MATQWLAERLLENLLVQAKKVGNPRGGPVHTLFKPGKSGNPKGRPKGSRNELSEDFISALAADFERHKGAVIERVRDENPAAYLKLVDDLVPKDFNLSHKTDHFALIWQAIGEGKFSSPVA